VFGEKYGTVNRAYPSFLAEILTANVIDFTENGIYIDPNHFPRLYDQMISCTTTHATPDLGIIITGYSDKDEGFALNAASETVTWEDSLSGTSSLKDVICAWLNVYSQRIPIVVVSPLSHVGQHTISVSWNMLDYHEAFQMSPYSNAIFVDGRKSQIDNSNLGTNIYGNGTTLTIAGHLRLARFLAKQLCYITN
jgi:hypothetical protein